MSQNSAPAAQEARKVDLDTSVKIVYSLNVVLNSMGSTMALSYFAFFVTEVVGLSPVIMATVYTIARFGDLAVQVFAPSIVNMMSRHRPLLLIIPLISQAGTIASFVNPPFPTVVLYPFLIIAYCCIHFPMNFSTVVTSTMQIKLTKGNQENRLWITAQTNRIGPIWRVVSPYLGMPLILWFMDRGLPGYLIVTCIYAAMTLAAAALLYVVSAPYEETKEEAAAAKAKKLAAAANQPSVLKVIGSQYSAAAKNRPAMALLISGLVTGITGQFLSGGTQYYWRFILGDLALQARAASISSMIAIPLGFIGPIIGRKMKQRQAVMLNFVWTICCYGLHIMFSGRGAWFYIGIQSLSSITTYISMVWSAQNWMNAAEVQYHNTGVDIRPFVMGLNNYSIKIGFIAQGPLLAWMLSYLQYERNVGFGNPGPFMFIWMGIPALGQIFAALMYFFFYNITPDQAKTAIAANHEKAQAERAAAAAAVAGGTPPAR